MSAVVEEFIDEVKIDNKKIILYQGAINVNRGIDQSEIGLCTLNHELKIYRFRLSKSKVKIPQNE